MGCGFASRTEHPGTPMQNMRVQVKRINGGNYILEKNGIENPGVGGTIERLSRKYIGIFEDGMEDGTPTVSK